MPPLKPRRFFLESFLIERIIKDLFDLILLTGSPYVVCNYWKLLKWRTKKLWERNSYTVRTSKWGFKFSGWFVCINSYINMYTVRSEQNSAPLHGFFLSQQEIELEAYMKTRTENYSSRCQTHSSDRTASRQKKDLCYISSPFTKVVSF
jgi:hypothetical protein